MKAAKENQELLNQIGRVADKLATPAPPGHVDYISKKDAAQVLRLILEFFKKYESGQ